MEHRFHLEKYKNPSSKHICPECGHKGCFVRYIDTEGEITFPDNVGRCDRENNCGYHYTPKQFFQDHPYEQSLLHDHVENVKVSKMSRTVNPKVEPYFFDESLMLATEKAYERNSLCTFLSSVLGWERTISQMQAYHTGTTKNGGTAYWLVNNSGKICDCKIMYYDAATGHRLKDLQHHPNWLHSLIRIDKERIRSCFFGEHLISLEANKDLPIAIVESEKSAIIASVYLPQFVWIATGGKDGVFSKADLSVLQGRKVILFPDLGMFDNWHQKAVTLIRHGIDASVYDFLEKNASETDRNAGLDIADFLLQTEQETETATSQTDKEKEMLKPKSEAKIRRYRNEECHACECSHEGINGTYCDQLGRYVEYGRGDCGKDGSPPL